WANGLDEEHNGKVDDLIGWDFHDNDNDPQVVDALSHGNGKAMNIGAIGNNGVGSAGVNWAIRMMPIRMQYEQQQRVDINAAAGIDHAVANGATISNNSWVGETYSQVIYDSIDRARLAGHLFIAAAGNKSSNADISPTYPAAYGLDNIISVA